MLDKCSCYRLKVVGRHSYYFRTVVRVDPHLSNLSTSALKKAWLRVRLPGTKSVHTTMFSGLRFLYRVVRTTGTGDGVAIESCSPNATHEPGTLCDAEEAHELKGVIFDMDGTLALPILDFLAIKTRIGIPPAADILPTVLRMPQKEKERALKIIEEYEDEGQCMACQ